MLVPVTVKWVVAEPYAFLYGDQNLGSVLLKC